MITSSKNFNRETDHQGNELFFIDELNEDLIEKAVHHCLAHNHDCLIERKLMIEQEHATKKALKKDDPKAKVVVNLHGKAYANIIKSIERNNQLYETLKTKEKLLEYGLYHLLTFNEKGEYYLFIDKKYYCSKL